MVYAPLHRLKGAARGAKGQGRGINRFEHSGWHLGSDEALPRMCAQPSTRRNTCVIGTSVPRDSRMIQAAPPHCRPLAQLMPMKVMLTLLLSCLVLMAHTHAMLQVHSWFRDHGDKAPRWPGKRPRSEVNACPRYHAYIDVYMFAGLISSSSAWLSSPDWCLERAPRDHQRPPMSPPDAILLFP